MRTVQHAIVVPLFAGLVTAGCGQSSDRVAGAEAAPPAAGQVADKGALPLDTAGRSGAFEMRLTRVTTATEWIKAPPAGHDYIVAVLQITNISKEAASIGAGDFGCVRDETGTRGSWERSTGVRAEPDTFGGKELAPGETFAGSLIFAIPTAMRQTELHYTVGYAPTPALRFQVRR